MDDFDQFERRLAAALRSDADMSVARFEPATIASAAVTSTQQRSLRIPRRFALIRASDRWPVAAAAVIGVLVVGGAFLMIQRSLPAVGGPSATPSPSPTQVPSPESNREIPYVITGPVSGPGSTPVEPGTYRMRGPGESPVGWPGTVIVTIPDQWYANSAVRGAGLKRTEDSRLAALGFGSVGNLVADPCASGEDRGPVLEPSLGPSVDELVAGLRSLPVLEFSEPVDVTLDGWEAKRLELTHPAGCGNAILWLTPPDAGESWTTSSREGWHSTLWILNITGLRFVVIAAYELDAPADVRLELQQMVDSVEIAP